MNRRSCVIVAKRNRPKLNTPASALRNWSSKNTQINKINQMAVVMYMIIETSFVSLSVLMRTLRVAIAKKNAEITVDSMPRNITAIQKVDLGESQTRFSN